jgi:hydroxymethylpyrimidine pyrophosphatase-like HAD family hydrolase
MPIADFAELVKGKLSTYQEQGFIEIKPSASAVDITPRGISKAEAVQGLLTAAGLLSEEVLGMDDGAAGAEWLKEVGFRATPANGDPALDEIVHYRSPYPEVRGTIDILQQLAWHGFQPWR